MFNMKATIPVRMPCQMSLSEISAMLDSQYIRELRKNGNLFGNTFGHAPTKDEIKMDIDIKDPLLIRTTNIHLDMDGVIQADIEMDAANWEPYMEHKIVGLFRVIGNPIARVFKLITVDCIIIPPET